MTIPTTYAWAVPCFLARFRDADTFVLSAQVPGEVRVPLLGLTGSTSFPVPIVLRLEGVNAPEKNTPEGKAAIAWVQSWFEEHGKAQFYFHTNGKLDSFGRWLGDLRSSQDAVIGLANDLLLSGHAEVYTRHGSW